MKKKTAIKWYSPNEPPFRIAGLAWFSKDRKYRRLPVRPEYHIRKRVDGLSNYPSGAQIRFQTNSKHLFIRVKLSNRADMDHMPPSGQCGFDCYAGHPKKLKYLSTTRFHYSKKTYECLLYEQPRSKKHNLVINFPLYQQVKEVMIGLDPKAKVLPPLPFRYKKPVVIYGTSITQGGCASRPGMSYPNILSRYLNLEIINLGFSGNGRGEPELAKIITGIKDPLCLVIDFEANCADNRRFRKRFPEFIRILRETHRKVPIVTISRIEFTKEFFYGEYRKDRLFKRDFQSKTVNNLRKKGDRLLYFIDGGTLLGRDQNECTVDGVHPTDLGFINIAKSLAPVFKRILHL